MTTTVINGGEPVTLVQTVSNGLTITVAPIVPVVLETTYLELIVQGGNNSTVVQTTRPELPVVESRVGPRIIVSESEPDPSLWDVWIPTGS